jgi:hypothetical protein
VKTDKKVPGSFGADSGPPTIQESKFLFIYRNVEICEKRTRNVKIQLSI